MHEYNHHITHAHLDSKTSDIFDKEEFSHYLVAAEGKYKDVANRISIDVVKFFNSVPHGSDDKHIDTILNTSTLVEYIHTLKQRSLAPSTIIDKLRNLRLCIEAN